MINTEVAPLALFCFLMSLLSVVTPSPHSCTVVPSQRRVLFINEYQSCILLSSTFSGGQLSCSPLATESMLGIDYILIRTRNLIHDKGRFLPD